MLDIQHIVLLPTEHHYLWGAPPYASFFQILDYIVKILYLRCDQLFLEAVAPDGRF